jgi:hypothetical protein
MAVSVSIAVLIFCFYRSGRYANPVSSRRPQCWTLCHHPPAILTLEDLEHALRSSINPRLSRLDRYSGFFTTPVFKMSGIQGWRAYGFDASAEGKVVQIAHSLDGMTTIDLAVEHVSIGDRTSPFIHGFVRIEIFKLVGRQFRTPILVDDHVRIAGSLMWDGDGFVEIHPAVPANIRVIESVIE